MSTLNFDPNDLTIGDLEDFEDLTGSTFEEAFKAVPVRDDEGNIEKDSKGKPVKAMKVAAKTLKALVFIIYRKDDPDFTVEMARNVKITALNMTGGDDADPEEPAVDPEN